jgi:outer membrane lipoprotein-sorting protein
MTSPRITRTLVGALATALAAGTLGCGILSQVKDAAGNLTALSDLADLLGKAKDLTYTAEYTFTGAENTGEKATLVQLPPNTAFVGGSGSFIFTPDALYFCGTEKGETVCQKTPNNTDAVGTGNVGSIGAAMGAGFMTPELAAGLLLVAAVQPGVAVETSEKTIAGQDSKCATASGLSNLTSSPAEQVTVSDLTVCVTGDGVLASFSGNDTKGEHASIELTNYATSADPAVFTPPAGAKIVETTQLPTT